MFRKNAPQFSLIAFLVLSALSLAGCGSAPASDNGETVPEGTPMPVYVRNNMDNPIYELYISSAEKEDWGEERLQGTPIKPKDFYEGLIYYADENDRTWDLAAVDNYGKTRYCYDMDFSGCRSNSVTITLKSDSDGNITPSIK